MSSVELARVYRGAWLDYYTPAHMETVLRRAAASRGMSAGNMLFLLMWFYNCIVLAAADSQSAVPLVCGYAALRGRLSAGPSHVSPPVSNS